MVKAALTNVYSDTNRGGSLLTLACAEMCARIGCDDVDLIPTKSDPAPGEFALVLQHSPAKLTGGPILQMGRGRLRDRLAIGIAWRALSRGREVPLHYRAPSYRTVEAATLAVGKGGQLFRNYNTRLSPASFQSSAAPLLAASQRGVPTALYGVQVGPYHHAPSMSAAKQALATIDLVLARDPVSAELAERLGASNVVQIPDTVFGLDTASLADTSEVGTDEYEVIVVSDFMVRELDATQYEGLVRVFRQRASSGDRRLVITAQSGGPHSADFVAASKLAAAIDHNAVQVVGTSLPAPSLLGLFAKAHLVLSGRVHGTIMALTVDTPALVLHPNTTKAVDLFDGMGLGEFRLSPDADTAIADLPDVLRRFDGDRATIGAEIGARRAQLHASVRAADSLIKDLLG